MPRHVDTILCEDIREEVGQKLTLVGVFSREILLTTPPAPVIPSIAFVQRWEFSREELQNSPRVRFRLTGPEGFPAIEVPEQGIARPALSHFEPTVNFNLRITPFPTQHRGEYQLRTFFQNREEYRFDFFIGTREEFVPL